MSQRFLLYFSYIGTKYNGMQRIVGRIDDATDFTTIQGILEFGLQKVLHIKDARVGISSRTDRGVHAIESAGHFDYHDAEVLSPEKLCRNLNVFLEKHETDIRIRRIVEVPSEFRVRREAVSRTYCYRIAVPRFNFYDSCNNHSFVTASIPIPYLNRVQIVPEPFYPHLIYDACKIFLGTWNFKTFCKPAFKSASPKEQLTEADYFKTVQRISLTRANSNIEHSYYIDPRLKDVDFFDFHVEGSGFLRRQVRRMVGALLGIGTGVITEKDIRFMLENPAHDSWNSKCYTALPDGLYLKSVNFPEDISVLRGSLI